MEFVKQMENKKRGNPNWVKGVSGNPNGRPKNGQTWAELVREFGNKVSLFPNKKGEPETRTYKEIAVARAWFIADYSEDERLVIEAQKYLRDTSEGRPTERHEVTGQDGGAIRVKFLVTTEDEETKRLAEEIVRVSGSTSSNTDLAG
jgi:hypothetical protein